ncbi:TetR/AcrR family transcriptional regulator [Noviherbaspirillum massiliense]|uniref:TetR/AcrR family transcriptional regulator n=1 Tax=Noviherbaspirillum massiliense TaxID=1465823 RepID=UPI0002F8245E|nr:TetR/AcrR family transcriptional regulator [Noviherbaspirillum massiliense]
MELKEKGKAGTRRPPRSTKPNGKPDAQSDKKRELALHMLSALADLGFAQLNLREVAARSGASLGSIHYYFKDKNDLLIYGLQLYKDGFIGSLDTLIDSAATLDGLAAMGTDAIANVIEDDGHLHRLWFDVRTQALFDPAFRPIVKEIEGRLIGVAERFLARVRALGAKKSPSDALSLYLTIDALVRYFLQQHLAGDTQAIGELRRQLIEIFHRLVKA